jgi:hypothetical protein
LPSKALKNIFVPLPLPETSIKQETAGFRIKKKAEKISVEDWSIRNGSHSRLVVSDSTT